MELSLLQPMPVPIMAFSSTAAGFASRLLQQVQVVQLALSIPYVAKCRPEAAHCRLSSSARPVQALSTMQQGSVFGRYGQLQFNPKRPLHELSLDVTAGLCLAVMKLALRSRDILAVCSWSSNTCQSAHNNSRSWLRGAWIM